MNPTLGLLLYLLKLIIMSVIKRKNSKIVKDAYKEYVKANPSKTIDDFVDIMGNKICLTCGNPVKDHNYRHPLTIGTVFKYWSNKK